MIGFMRFFTLKRQFIIFIISVVSIVPLYLYAEFAGAWIPILVSLILLVKYILIGTVNAAAMQLQIGDFDGAEKILSYTKKPEWLRFSYHGMYYLIKCNIAFQKKDYKTTEIYANKALTLDLQDDFKGMIYLQLMNIYGLRKNTHKVKELYAKANKLKVTQLEIKQNIEQVGMMLNGTHPQQRQMTGKKAQRSAMSQGYMKRGRGKKR